MLVYLQSKRTLASHNHNRTTTAQQTTILTMTTTMTMNPSSSLVNVAEQAELSLIKLLSSHMQTASNLQTVEEDCENLIAHADAVGFVRRVLLSDDFPALDVLLQSTSVSESDEDTEQQVGISDVDAVSAFALLVALLQRATDEDGVPIEAVSDVHRNIVIKIMSKKPSAKNKSAMGMLKVLFDLATVLLVKIFIFRSIVQLAVEDESDVLLAELMKDRHMYDFNASLLSAKQLTSLVERLDGSSAEDSQEMRSLFKVVAHALERCCATSSAASSTIISQSLMNEKQRVLLMQLETYKTEAEIDQNALVAATQVATCAIRDPISLFSEQRNMLKLPVILALKKTDNGSDLYSLLTIFTEGTFEEYQNFLAASSKNSFFSKHTDLSEEQCTRNMRLLSLCTLASESKTPEISYTQIATALDVSRADVEDWVIAARGSGLIDAKMDQIREVITVERCVVRKFGIEQWMSLQRKLNLWKANVRVVLEGLKENEAKLNSGA